MPQNILAHGSWVAFSSNEIDVWRIDQSEDGINQNANLSIQKGISTSHVWKNNRIWGLKHLLETQLAVDLQSLMLSSNQSGKLSLRSLSKYFKKSVNFPEKLSQKVTLVTLRSSR